MSGASPAGRTSGKSSKKDGKAQKPFWQRDLGKKKGVEDEAVEHPPFAPTLPRVDLLPESVRQSIAVGRARRAIIGAFVVLLLAGGVVWYLQGARISESEARLAQAQQEGQSLQKQVDALAPVKAFYTELENQKALVNATLASQPQAAVVIDRLQAAGREAGDGAPVTFSAIGVAYKGIPQPKSPLNPCTNPDPFGTEIAIGCITFSANAQNRQQVSTLLEVMEADPLFVGPYVTSTSLETQEDDRPGGVFFSGTAGVSLDGLKTALTPEQVDAILNPPKPEATEEAQPEGEVAQ